MLKQNQSGFSVIEALVATAILGIIAVGIATFFSNQIAMQKMLSAKGEFEDAKTLIRASIDCKQTVKAIGTKCKNKGFADHVYVALLKSDSSLLLGGSTSASTTRLGKDWEFRVSCRDDKPSFQFLIERRYRPLVSTPNEVLVAQAGGWKDAFPNVPVICDQPAQGWYAAYKKNCTTFCATIGLTNTLSPDTPLGSYCASGEHTPASSKDAYFAGVFTFPDGCWGGPCPNGAGNQGGSSFGNRCYGINSNGKGQKQDNDSTDNIVACHCE